MSYRKGWPPGVVGMLAGAIVAAFIFVSAAPAAAHTALEASSPKDGGTIDVAPSRVLMRFTEPVLNSGYRLVVIGPDDRAYQAGAAQIAGKEVTQALKPLGASGEYRVEFRIVSADGHPLTGGLRFTLSKPGPAAGGAPAVARPAPLAAVSTSDSVNNAPPWAPWIIAGTALVAICGAVLGGRRVTRGLD